jgi:SAM-dependent methyltransferase
MTATIANTEMAQAWNGPEGDDWARDWEHYDAGVVAYHRRLVEAAAVQPGERVLDVGCGNGQVARELAAAGAKAVGIDLSRQMVARARELAGGSAEFVEGDAQVHPFADGEFDVVVSRFGAMFFGDRRAAFRNLARATAPGGRIVLAAWAALDQQQWLQEIRGALALGRDLPAPPPGAPSPFGLADVDTATAVLREAGYGDATATLLTEDFVAGTDADDAYAFIGSSGVVRGLLEGLPPEQQEEGRANLRTALASHDTGHGVVFASNVWLYTGTRD